MLTFVAQKDMDFLQNCSHLDRLKSAIEDLCYYSIEETVVFIL